MRTGNGSNSRTGRIEYELRVPPKCRSTDCPRSNRPINAKAALSKASLPPPQSVAMTASSKGCVMRLTAAGPIPGMVRSVGSWPASKSHQLCGAQTWQSASVITVNWALRNFSIGSATKYDVSRQRSSRST